MRFTPKLNTCLERFSPCRKDVLMSSRRKFSAEFKVEVAHRVIDSGRSVGQVAFHDQHE